MPYTNSSVGIIKQKEKMKTTLTTVESQHLISLGVPKEKASRINCNPWTKEYTHIFKLKDFLNGEILPKEIKVNGEIANLCFDWNFITKRWGAAYSLIYEVCKSYEEELIDSLYQLACWYYGEYLKSKEK